MTYKTFVAVVFVSGLLATEIPYVHSEIRSEEDPYSKDVEKVSAFQRIPTHHYQIPSEPPARFCESYFPGVAPLCCGSLTGSKSLVYQTTGMNKMKKKGFFVVNGLSKELRGGKLSSWFLSEMAYASGKRLPFDIGHFNHCKNIKGSRYFLVTVSSTHLGVVSIILVCQIT